MKKLLHFSGFLEESLRNKICAIMIFIISYITPLIGIVIAYMQNKNGKTSLYKNSSIFGVSIALIIFVLQFIVFAIKSGSTL